MSSSIGMLPKDAAIQAALLGNWKDAIKINEVLIREDNCDIDALNRLAYAYGKDGQLPRAKRLCTKVLTLDPYNTIAIKNIKLLSNTTRKKMKGTTSPAAAPSAFLEDPGKTKIVSCVNLATAQVISSLSPGQVVAMKSKNHAVELRSDEGTYLAALPDDISYKLLKRMAAGNTYQVVVKGVGKNTLTVMVRELTRGKRFANQPSFISSTSTTYTPFTPADVKEGDKPTVTATGEEDLEEDEVKPDDAAPGTEETT